MQLLHVTYNILSRASLFEINGVAIRLLNCQLFIIVSVDPKY